MHPEEDSAKKPPLHLVMLSMRHAPHCRSLQLAAIPEKEEVESAAIISADGEMNRSATIKAAEDETAVFSDINHGDKENHQSAAIIAVGDVKTRLGDIETPDNEDVASALCHKAFCMLIALLAAMVVTGYYSSWIMFRHASHWNSMGTSAALKVTSKISQFRYSINITALVSYEMYLIQSNINPPDAWSLTCENIPLPTTWSVGVDSLSANTRGCCLNSLLALFTPGNSLQFSNRKTSKNANSTWLNLMN